MSSNLTIRQGIYDPTKRFAFKNITEEPFTFTWNSDPITVKAGQEVELPHHMAILATGKIVDKIMMDIARDDEQKQRKINKDPLWRSPKGIAVGVPEARRVWEEQVLRELKVDDENPQVAVMRAQMREELLKDLKGEKSTTPPTLPVSAKDMMKEFEGANVKPKK